MAGESICRAGIYPAKVQYLEERFFMRSCYRKSNSLPLLSPIFFPKGKEAGAVSLLPD
ncbi:MAG: hypothetical protein AB1611_18005 [bacterium]